MGFFNPASLVKQFELNNSIESVRNYISRNESGSFSIIKLSATEYIFLANLSLGTLIKNGRPPNVNGIQTKVVLSLLNKNTTVITFTTKLRFELIITFVAWVLFAIFQLTEKPDVPIWIITAFFPGLLIWFFLVYRIQEKILQSKAEAYLRAL